MQVTLGSQSELHELRMKEVVYASDELLDAAPAFNIPR